MSAAVIAGKVSERCEREIVASLLKSTYIPAQHEGKPIDGDFIETWYTASMRTPMPARPRPRPLPQP